MPPRFTPHRTADLQAFRFGDWYDCVVTCDQKSWNLHRVILARSEWFDKALVSGFLEGHTTVINISEQDPNAVEICLKYIYGGVSRINMDQELQERGQDPILFCAEVYRSADFFGLKALCNTTLHYLSGVFDEKIAWMYTRGTAVYDYQQEQRAGAWIADLKDAIVEAESWNTPVINNMLKEFVWAGRGCLVCTRPSPAPHIDISEWLNTNFPDYMTQAHDLCSAPVWETDPNMDPTRDVVVWTPKPCSGPVPDQPAGKCVRCGEGFDEPEECILWDPFNASQVGEHTRAWCEECVEDLEHPWRVDGYA